MLFLLLLLLIESDLGRVSHEGKLAEERQSASGREAIVEDAAL